MNRINGWIRHWQTLPIRNRIGATLCLVVLLFCTIALAYQIGGLAADIHKSVRTPDPVAVPGHVWDKTLPLLEQADRQAALVLDKHLASIHAFLGERKAGSKAFAEQMVSLQGKWKLVVASIGDDSNYASFLQQTFREHLFAMEELEKAVATAVLATW